MSSQVASGLGKWWLVSILICVRSACQWQHVLWVLYLSAFSGKVF